MKDDLISKLFSDIESSGKDEEEPQRFQVRIETGEILEAEMLTVLEIGGCEYAVYTIPAANGKRDILASRVVQDDDGFDMLVDLDDPEVKEDIRNFIQETLLQACEPVKKS